MKDPLFKDLPDSEIIKLQDAAIDTLQKRINVLRVTNDVLEETIRVMGEKLMMYDVEMTYESSVRRDN